MGEHLMTSQKKNVCKSRSNQWSHKQCGKSLIYSGRHWSGASDLSAAQTEVQSWPETQYPSMYNYKLIEFGKECYKFNIAIDIRHI